MYTFADNQEPSAREAAKAAKVPISQDFKFNNSAIFPSKDIVLDDEFNMAFWEMGYKSFEKFFDSMS